MRNGFLALLAITAAMSHPGSALAQVQEAQILRPGDVLRITVWPDSGLSGEFLVGENGELNLPFLGTVRTAGVPINELRTQLRAGYAENTRNPVVTVTPLFRIGVTGSVRRPGAYLIPPTDGFFDVIAEAGGFDIRAKENDVRVLREGSIIQLNAEDAIKKGDTLPLEALTLRSGDQIIVPFGSEPWSRRDWLAVGNFLISLILLWDRLGN